MTRASGPRVAAALAAQTRRLIICAIFDKDGHIDDYVAYSLAALRPHAARILVMVNGALTPESRSALDTVADEVLVRENTGYDIGAHRAALAYLGDGLREFDEIILTNDTWYGPMRPWGPVFARMDRSACDFWGLTDHAPSGLNPFTRGGAAPYHLQSYWIAVRRAMFESEDWRRYWAALPPLDTYIDAVIEHELRFTQHFAEAGWTPRAAFPIEEFDTENPSLFEAETLLERGCPVLKRRPLFHWPPLLDAHGVVGAWTLASAASAGYPVELILRNLARTVPPKAMNVDVGLLSVLPADDEPPAHRTRDAPDRVLVVIHSSGAPVQGVLERARAAIAGGFDLVVTTTDADARQSLEADLARRRPADRRTEVRGVPSGASAASALLIGVGDVLRAGEYEFVVRLLALDPPGDGAQGHLRAHLYGNLLPDEEYFSALVALFRREPSLGIAYPPMLHIGHETLGRDWGELRPVFEDAARSLRIAVPLDDVSPLAPPEGMFVARGAALRLLTEAAWGYEQFDRTERLADAVERMWSYGAGQLGYHTRTVTSRESVSLSHAFLEYELDAMSSTIPGAPYEKIDFLRHSGWAGSGSARDLVRMFMRRRHPWVVHVARRLADPTRLPGRLARRRAG